VAIDKQLKGVRLCLRESMNKFKDHGEDYAMIEIARPVVKPNIPHLNRYLQLPYHFCFMAWMLKQLAQTIDHSSRRPRCLKGYLYGVTAKSCCGGTDRP
jgi:hypothetical protein